MIRIKTGCILIGWLVLVFSACISSSEIFDSYGYKMTPVGTGGYILAEKKMADGKELERGFVRKNKKEGTWTTYHHDRDLIQYVTGYLNGQLNGTHLEFNENGNLVKEENYLNGVLHGAQTRYAFSRIVSQATYKMGKFDGTYKEYNDRGQLQRRVDFKDGKEHGYLRYYDAEGKVTIEYFYQNGERISGGMVEDNEEN